MTIDDLCDNFKRATQLHVYNPTPFPLYLGVGGGVFTNAAIPAYTCIGRLDGEAQYIWDMHHQEYIIVGDEFVLDASKLCPRPALTWIREENQTDAMNNCVIRMEVNDETGETFFFVWTTRPLNIGDELVYTVVDANMYY